MTLRSLLREAAYIPRNPLEGHWLVEAIGWEQAQKLSDYYGATGGRVTIPKGQQHRYSKSKADVARLSDEGMSVVEVAAALNMHERTVYRLRRNVHQDRAKRLGKRIRYLLANSLSHERIAVDLGMPLHSVRPVIDLLKGKG